MRPGIKKVGKGTKTFAHWSKNSAARNEEKCATRDFLKKGQEIKQFGRVYQSMKYVDKQEPEPILNPHYFQARAKISSDIPVHFKTKTIKAWIIIFLPSQTKPAQLKLFDCIQLELRPDFYILIRINNLKKIY